MQFSYMVFLVIAALVFPWRNVSSLRTGSIAMGGTLGFDILSLHRNENDGLRNISDFSNADFCALSCRTCHLFAGRNITLVTLCSRELERRRAACPGSLGFEVSSLRFDSRSKKGGIAGRIASGMDGSKSRFKLCGQAQCQAEYSSSVWTSDILSHSRTLHLVF